MQEAIFQTTSQALHVCYLIRSVDARQKNALRMALIRIIESVELPSARLKAWLKQLRGESSGTVNFDGLDSYEVRAQCAMVTQAVVDHLPTPEKHVIWGKFSNQVERAAAVKGLADYIAPQLTFTDRDAIHALLYGHFSPHMRKRGLSYDEISRDRGIHTKTLKRANSVIVGTLRILEDMAVERLTPMFERDGLVEWRIDGNQNTYKKLA